MVPISAPLQNWSLSDLKIHPELITRLFSQEEDMSVIFAKRGNLVSVAYLRTYDRDTTRILAEAKQEYAHQQIAGYSNDQAFEDFKEAWAEIRQLS